MRFLFLSVALALLLLRGLCHADEPAPVPLKGEKRIVPAISAEFVAVDVVRNGGVKFPAFNNSLDPLTRFEFRPAVGKTQWFDTKDGASIPAEYFAGYRFYLEGAQIGEAVLIKITSEVFPWERKTYVTYNVATAGNLTDGRLIAATPPPYYNTVPVDGDFRTSGSANPSYQALIAFPLLCDSPTSPSIGLTPFSDSTLRALQQATGSVTAQSRDSGEEWRGEFPTSPGNDTYHYFFYWGQTGASTDRSAFFGSAGPMGEIDYSFELDWMGHVFASEQCTTSIATATANFIDLPMGGGNGAILAVQSALTGRVSELQAVPAPNLLLDAARDAHEGRAILSTHLFPHCDANHNGRIDAEDLALLAAQIPTGMVTY